MYASYNVFFKRHLTISFIVQLLLTIVVKQCYSLPNYSDVLFVEDTEPIVTNIQFGNQDLQSTENLNKLRSGREIFIDTPIINKNDKYNIKKLDNSTLNEVDINNNNNSKDGLVELLNNSTYDNATDNSHDDVLTKVNANYESRIFYDGAQVWKLKLNNIRVLGELNQLNTRKEIGWWGGNISFIDMMVKPTSRQYVHDLLKSYNITYEVIINDLQAAIDAENPQFDEELELANRKGHRMTWQSYHRLEDIHGYLDHLAETYPKICSVKEIGKSVHGRSLKILKVSNGNDNNKAIWIDGGMHAREWVSPATVTFIINQIVENYSKESDDVKNVDWYFHPVANPDGYEHTHTNDRLWRKNRARSGFCAGTDLNRNFGYRWGGKGSSRFPCTETYAGQRAFSEPESRAIKNFFDSTKADFKAYLSFHSYGQYILYPWGYDNVVPPDYKDLQNVGQKMAQEMKKIGDSTYTVGSAASTLYPAAGGSDDWAKGSRKIKYSYTIELRDTGRYGFVLPSTYIVPTGKEAMAAIRVVAGAVNELP